MKVAEDIPCRVGKVDRLCVGDQYHVTWAHDRAIRGKHNFGGSRRVLSSGNQDIASQTQGVVRGWAKSSAVISVTPGIARETATQLQVTGTYANAPGSAGKRIARLWSVISTVHPPDPGVFHQPLMPETDHVIVILHRVRWIDLEVINVQANCYGVLAQVAFADSGVGSDLRAV